MHLCLCRNKLKNLTMFRLEKSLKSQVKLWWVIGVISQSSSTPRHLLRWTTTNALICLQVSTSPTPTISVLRSWGGHSNASKSFNFSQHLRTMRCCCWRALSPWAKTKTRAAKNICIKRRETDKSIWIDKCHQNRSGIKFIMPSGGLARWGQSPAELWQPPGGWNTQPQSLREAGAQRHRSTRAEESSAGRKSNF